MFFKFCFKTFYINLFPAVAGPDRVSDSYEGYIKEYVDQIGTDYISYDHYPLKYNPQNVNYIVPTFLYNMEVFYQGGYINTNNYDFYKILEGSTNLMVVDSITEGQCANLAILRGRDESEKCALSQIITSPMAEDSDIIYLYTEKGE